MIIEGQEKDDFWSVLGGRAEYSSDPVLRVSVLEYFDCKLFCFLLHVLLSTGDGEVVTCDFSE